MMIDSAGETLACFVKPRERPWQKLAVFDFIYSADFFRPCRQRDFELDTMVEKNQALFAPFSWLKTLTGNHFRC